MSKVKTLEKEIRKLTRHELRSFREWFIEFDSDEWDRQIEGDIKAGKLDRIAAEAIAAHERGESKEL